jgi:hypothetical protein
MILAGVDKVGLLLSHDIFRVNRESKPKISINHRKKPWWSILSGVNVRLDACVCSGCVSSCHRDFEAQPLRHEDYQTQKIMVRRVQLSFSHSVTTTEQGR